MKNRTALLFSLGAAIGFLGALAYADCSSNAAGLDYDDSGDQLVLTNARPLSACALMHGPYSQPATPLGSGLLCAVPLYRGDVTYTDEAGGALLELPPLGHYAQAWFREADGSIGLSVMVQP